ncbi:MAG: GNAT family N-acetyltransferase [Acutalibacter sp.]|nr:GNAT family N-acetyltransferase [Acutalibacter sp.]
MDNPILTLELLNPENEVQVKQIQRDDVPDEFAEEVADTIELAKYGNENHLRGHCYCMKYGENYIGILLIGEAIEDEADPAELKGTGYFRIMGFVLDRNYRGQGLGSKALELALREIYEEYGKVPILLECHKDNVRAADFYTRLGFRNTKILNHEDYFFIKD